MADDLRRIELPSGGWWEILTRPRWKHLRQWADRDRGHQDSPHLVEFALVSLTTAWSFPDRVSLGTLARRETEDLIAALEAFQEDVVPWLEAGNSKASAEGLFAGLMTGRIPPQFAEAHVLAATGWSWQALQETPADLVRKMTTYLAVKQARDNQGTLEFPDDKEDLHDAH